MTILFRLDLPLFIKTSVKNKFILNLNTYRNLHFRSLSSAKNRYKGMIFKLLDKRRKKRIKAVPLTVIYDYYHGSARRHDVMNQVSIIDKFTLDALVEYGLLEDDNSNIVKQYIITDRGIDRENPRAEMRIRRYAE